MSNLMMKKFSIIGIFVFSIISLSYSSGKKENEWKLVWEENFDKVDSFDTAVWSKIPRGGADWNKFMSDHDSCYAMIEGNLVLRGIPNTILVDDTAKVLTGGVWSKGKKSFQNGRIEFRAKLGEAKGAWPAIWMMPEGRKWPEGGEIDVMEHLNFDSIVYQTIHTQYTLAEKVGPQRFATHSINRNDYNVFAVEFYKDSLRFFTNDELTFCYPRVEELGSEQFPFEDEFYILISNQVGGNWVGEYDISQLPVDMYIDWIRFYTKKK